MEGDAAAWIADTLQWMGRQADPMESRGAAMLRGPEPALQPPREIDWPPQLLAAMPEFIQQFFEQHRDVEQAAERFDLLGRNLALWLQQYIQRLRADRAGGEESARAADEVAIGLARLYRAVQPFGRFAAESTLLQTLLAIPSSQSVPLWCSLMVDAPPAGHHAATAGVETLIRRGGWDAEEMFPQLLAALDHPSTIAAVLDLANWCVRNAKLDEHPAADSSERLLKLLVAVAGRLKELETNPLKFGRDVRDVQRVLDESVALCIALCDTLGLIGDEEALPALLEAAGLRHRRIACEAAAAAARLGEPAAAELLIALAAEPIARRRVIAYAEELGIADRVDDIYRAPPALAEADVAVYLSSPETFGLAPRELELIDDRRLMWPGFSEPQHCYLLRFGYAVEGGQYSNIAIAGPLVHTFAADLAELPVMDIYAAFAGWHAEHAEITAAAAADLDDTQQQWSDRRREELLAEGFEDIRVEFVGGFFEDRALVGTATRGGQEGAVVYDSQETLWYPHSGRQRPVGPAEAFDIYKGRRLLRSFNPGLA